MASLYSLLLSRGRWFYFVTLLFRKKYITNLQYCPVVYLWYLHYDWCLLTFNLRIPFFKPQKKLVKKLPPLYFKSTTKMLLLANIWFTSNHRRFPHPINHMKIYSLSLLSKKSKSQSNFLLTGLMLSRPCTMWEML